MTYSGEESDILFDLFNQDTDAIVWNHPLEMTYQHLYGIWNRRMNHQQREEIRKDQMNR